MMTMAHHHPSGTGVARRPASEELLPPSPANPCRHPSGVTSPKENCGAERPARKE